MSYSSDSSVFLRVVWVSLLEGCSREERVKGFFNRVLRAPVGMPPHGGGKH